MTVIALLVLCAFTCESARETTTPAAPPQTQQQSDDNGPRVILKDGFAVKVEVAADDDLRQQGLMYRNQLAEDRGMLFFFRQDGEYAFWMKNTLIPLDMIWIDASKKVVHVTANVPPCQADPCPSYPPGAKARYVLELAAGVAAKHHIAVGDVLRYEGMDQVNVR